MKKCCSYCKIKKSLTDFYLHKNGKYGVSTQCKNCVKEYIERPEVKKHRKEYDKKYRSDPKKKKRFKENGQRYRKDLKLEVLNAYGNKCGCCGEITFEFLSMEHKNKTGLEHRKIIGSGGTKLYRWLIKNNFPKQGFEINCFNCNLSKGFYGYCPHKKKRKERKMWGPVQKKYNFAFEISYLGDAFRLSVNEVNVDLVDKIIHVKNRTFVDEDINAFIEKIDPTKRYSGKLILYDTKGKIVNTIKYEALRLETAMLKFDYGFDENGHNILEKNLRFSYK